MFESRSIASLSRSGISVHTRANSFHNISLRSTSSKKAMRRKKGKQIRYVKKRKQTENDKTPGSEQPVVKSVCGSLTMRRRAESAIIVRHRASLNEQPASWRELRTTKGPLCMNTALRLRRQRRARAKLMEPTGEVAYTTTEREDSSEQ